MKIIALSLDKKILDPHSPVAQRVVFFGNSLDRYIIIVPGADKKIELSAKILVLGVGGVNKVQSLFNIYQRLNSLLKKESFDLLTVQDTAFLAFLGHKIAKKFSLRLEVQVHGFEKSGFLRNYLAKKVLNQADLVRVVSGRLKSHLIKTYSINAEKIYIAPVAINVEDLADSHTIDLHKIYPEHFIFLTIGRLVPVKNIALQFAALKNIADRQKVKLIVVGDGPEKDHLKKLANDLNIREQVIFFGWQDNLGDFYHSADCLLLTSDSEGYGMVVAEAVACSLPVIMTDVGCAHELIKDGVNGFIIPVNNLSALQEKMHFIRGGEALVGMKNNQKEFQDKIVSLESWRKDILAKWKNIV